MPAQDEDLARRVYSYYIFRLRQPEEARRLTRECFQRVWRQENLSREADQEPDLPTFETARLVIAENPRRRGSSRVVRGEDEHGLSTELAMALGRLHGREREALALRFGAELSIGEIAELIDRTPAEVKQRLARGVRSLIDLGVLPKESERPASAERPGPRGAERGDSQEQ